MSDAPLYGLLAEFDGADRLLDAARRARAAIADGALAHCALEAYAPFPVEELAETLEQKKARDPIPPAMLLGALFGGVGTFALEWYAAVFNYPINVGGRPLGSWQAFLPPAIEMTVLWSALFGVVAMLIGNGLPRVHHPLFAVPAFERVSSDGFFLLLRAGGANFDAPRARELLETLAPRAISEVPA